MKVRLLNIWEFLKTSFWFVPGVMVVTAIVAAILVVKIDQNVKIAPFSVLGVFYITGPEGARSILSTIAGSMVTVAGVAFSIIIVALTLASSQLGPRLLRNFMSDRGNQIVLGTFIATFVYCLIVLGSVGKTEELVFVPSISIVLALVLAIANVGLLIYFIHHVAASIQADHLIAVVYHELQEHIERLFPSEGENGKHRRPKDEELQRDRVSNEIAAPKDGYLQAVNHNRLVSIAAKNGGIIEIHFKAGEFIAKGISMATLKSDNEPDEEAADQIANSMILGTQRTPEQDVEFAIRQLVEVAVRALSPGINDPYTAMACVDRLGSALCELTKRDFPPSYYYDDDGELRVLAKVVDFEGATNAAFDQIRQYGRQKSAILIRLLEALNMIGKHAKEDVQKNAVGRQADMILESSHELPEKNDQRDVEERYQDLKKTLES